jgi:hypothetical protein
LQRAVHKRHVAIGRDDISAVRFDRHSVLTSKTCILRGVRNYGTDLYGFIRVLNRFGGAARSWGQGK